MIISDSRSSFPGPSWNVKTNFFVGIHSLGVEYQNVQENREGGREEEDRREGRTEREGGREGGGRLQARLLMPKKSLQVKRFLVDDTTSRGVRGERRECAGGFMIREATKTRAEARALENWAAELAARRREMEEANSLLAR